MSPTAAKMYMRKVERKTLQPEETVVSYNVTLLAICIPTAEAIKELRKHPKPKKTHDSWTKLKPGQVCSLLDLCLNTTYFTYKDDRFYREEHGSYGTTIVYYCR